MSESSREQSSDTNLANRDNQAETSNTPIFDRFSDDSVFASLQQPLVEEPDGKMIGEDIDSVVEHWDGVQSYPDTCAVRCSEYVIECFTGSEVDEHRLVHEALDHGWYQPGRGTSFEGIAGLLESHGVETRLFENSNVFHLADELANGHKVIIGVDSSELWHRVPIIDDLKDALGFEAADHAVVVSGIDTTEPGNPCVIISDPGTGEPAARYPLDRFIDAWRDSGFTMVSTVESAPAHLPEMAGFQTDLFQQKLFSVAGVPFLDYLHQLWMDTDEVGDFPYAESGRSDITAISEVDDPDTFDAISAEDQSGSESLLDTFDVDDADADVELDHD